MNNTEKAKDSPLYIKLADELRMQIQTNLLKENEKLPTEQELCQKYGVSRITVRKALSILTDEEMLIKKQGKGTYVTGKRMLRSLNSAMGFSQSCERIGVKPGARFLLAELAAALPQDVKYLHLKDTDDKVLRIRRVRLCDDEPVMIEELHFPRAYSFLLAEDLTQSIHAILEYHGVLLKHGFKQISISYATREDAKVLNIAENDALLYVQDTCQDASGTPVYYGKSVINANKYAYTVDIEASEQLPSVPTPETVVSGQPLLFSSQE